MTPDQPDPVIAVVGSLNIDLIAYAKRVPNAGETVIGERFQMGFGGKGANQAVMAARLGGRVSMIGALGDDVYAGMTVDNLIAQGVDATHVARVGGLERRRADLGGARRDEPDHRRAGRERPVVVPRRLPSRRSRACAAASQASSSASWRSLRR